MKKTTYLIATLAAALFSGASFAGMDNVDDVLHGSGNVVASPSIQYVFVKSGPQGTEGDVLYGQEELKASAFSPYERVSNDRDNRDDLRDNIS